MATITQATFAEMDRLFKEAETAVAGDPDSLEQARLATQQVILIYAAKEDPPREKPIRDFFPLATLHRKSRWLANRYFLCCTTEPVRVGSQPPKP
ncbi:MAG: hypothetical protein MK171_13390 [Pirellulales bacterium]|nr:hypothetical protein [Pirellulales bacterium]